MHHTPLAGLFALEQTAAPGGGKTRSDSLSFLDHHHRFMYAGKDAQEREVYAVWARTDRTLLPRLIGTFCSMFDIGPGQYAVRRITVPPGPRLRLATFCYRIGFYGLGRRLLERLEKGRSSPLPAGQR